MNSDTYSSGQLTFDVLNNRFWQIESSECWCGNSENAESQVESSKVVK